MDDKTFQWQDYLADYFDQSESNSHTDLYVNSLDLEDKFAVNHKSDAELSEKTVTTEEDVRNVQNDYEINRRNYVVKMHSDSIISYGKRTQDLIDDSSLIDESYFDRLLEDEEKDDSARFGMNVSNLKEKSQKGFPLVVISDAEVDSVVLSGLLEGKLTGYQGGALDLIENLSEAGSTRLFDLKNLLID